MLSYIDPGTGSMLFSVLIGIIGALLYSIRKMVIWIQFILSGGREAKMNKNKLPYVIYSDSKRYWNTFEPICNEFENREIPLTYMTSSSDDDALKNLGVSFDLFGNCFLNYYFSYLNRQC